MATGSASTLPVIQEHECFQEELRKAQRKLLKVSRDKRWDTVGGRGECLRVMWLLWVYFPTPSLELGHKCMAPGLGLVRGSRGPARRGRVQGNLAELGINTLALPASSLSFLLDRLLQYENVDEDSSGEQGHGNLVEDVAPGPSASFMGPS